MITQEVEKLDQSSLCFAAWVGFGCEGEIDSPHLLATTNLGLDHKITSGVVLACAIRESVGLQECQHD